MAHTILVVDDNEINLVLITKILEMESNRVLTTTTCSEAIRVAMQEKPDMAILDVMMPDMDGYELCKKMRQPPVSAVFPIVMLTAMNSPTERALALAAGANDIWSKPFDMDTFRLRVAELLKTVLPGAE
jgi:CheY-like chemotaxis protein